GIRFELGVLFIPVAVLVIVGSSNAVNLTDGLDGLAGGCVIVAAAALGIVAHASGHAGLAEYLNLTRMPGSHEMLVLVGGLIGALLGFLWFNCHPAQVFMGDTGSLPLGGLLGLLAVVTRQELLLLLVGGVFVAETLSVIVQVGCFRLTGQRVFRCAPLHHHFQFLGWPESKIVVRFWIAAALCAVVGVSSLRFSLSSLVPAQSSLFPTLQNWHAGRQWNVEGVGSLFRRESRYHWQDPSSAKKTPDPLNADPREGSDSSSEAERGNVETMRSERQ
ncbi:MAG: phospho-N-acetylmuramoyl-pentapeptide-transferase, partial [Pirellulales bacterium]